MERSEMLAALEDRGIVPAVKNGQVVPSVHTCPVCGGYKSLYVPGMADDGSGCLRGSHYVYPPMAFTYAAYADFLLAEAGFRPVGQLDRGPCACDHEHAWEFVAKTGPCLTRYRCTVPGCGAVNDVDSSD